VSELPPEIAAGPDSRRWGGSQSQASAAWHAAGRTWSRANGHSDKGWLSLLSREVRYAVSARGRLDPSMAPPWRAGS